MISLLRNFTVPILFASLAAHAEVPSFADGVYVLQGEGRALGHDLHFSLNDGDTISLPRGEFKIQSTDEGYLVAGCLSLYRGSLIRIRQMCGEKDGAVYCRVPSPDAQISSVEDLASAKEVAEVFLTPAEVSEFRIRVTDEASITGGPVESFNTVNRYVLNRDRGLKCVFPED
mgnify:CR=1 FL=1